MDEQWHTHADEQCLEHIGWHVHVTSPQVYVRSYLGCNFLGIV